MRLTFLYSLLFLSGFIYAQNEYTKQNIWLSFNGQFNTSKFRFVLDGGHRTFDRFYNKNRTSLIRLSAAYNVYDNLFIGIGFASFYHYSYFAESVIIQNELRPFFQANYFKNIKSGILRFRFRNEFRYWRTDELLRNRSRLLVSYLHNFKETVKLPVIQYEGFLSGLKNTIHEHRLQLGFQVAINQYFGLLPHYMLQFQSNNSYMQNIIGLTLQFSTPNAL